MYGGEWHIGDNSNNWGEIKSEKWEEGGGAPNCAGMVSQWRCKSGDQRTVTLTCNDHK